MTAVSRSFRSKSVRQKEPSHAPSPLAVSWPDELAALPDEAERHPPSPVSRRFLIERGRRESGKELLSCAANLWQDLAPQDAVEQQLVLNVLRVEIVTRTTAFQAIPREGKGDVSANIRDLLRLTSASAKLLEQLDRRRRGVQQRVVVEHVHVAAGGQAIVGAVGLDGGRVRAGRG